MRKVLTGLIMIILCTACATNPTYSDPDRQPLPRTKSVCNLFGSGWEAERIIADQLESGYEFTGSTTGMICENVLHFRLIEETK